MYRIDLQHVSFKKFGILEFLLKLLELGNRVFVIEVLISNHQNESCFTALACRYYPRNSKSEKKKFVRVNIWFSFIYLLRYRKINLLHY